MCDILSLQVPHISPPSITIPICLYTPVPTYIPPIYLIPNTYRPSYIPTAIYLHLYLYTAIYHYTYMLIYSMYIKQISIYRGGLPSGNAESLSQPFPVLLFDSIISFNPSIQKCHDGPVPLLLLQLTTMATQ